MPSDSVRSDCAICSPLTRALSHLFLHSQPQRPRWQELYLEIQLLRLHLAGHQLPQEPQVNLPPMQRAWMLTLGTLLRRLPPATG